MDNHTISIFGSKIFLEIINEVKLFSKFKIKFYNNLDLCIEDAEKESQLVVFFYHRIIGSRIFFCSRALQAPYCSAGREVNRYGGTCFPP